MAGEIRPAHRVAGGARRRHRTGAGEERPASRCDHASRGKSGEPFSDAAGVARKLQRIRNAVQPGGRQDAVVVAAHRCDSRQPAKGIDGGSPAAMIGRPRWMGYALLAPALAAAGFLILYPVYLVRALSFRQGKTLNVLRLSELPFGLGNYRTIFASDATWHSVFVTVVY